MAQWHKVKQQSSARKMDFAPSSKEKKKMMKQSMLLCCKIYISESRNKAALDSIEQAANLDPETVIVNKFEDRAYNRVRYNLVSYVAHDSTGCPIYSPLRQTVLAMVEAAYGAVNLEFHSGAHPRLGVVDDIIFLPLARASLEEAAWLAKAVAADIGNRFQVPVYLYAAAHPTGKAVDTIRRELGYYRPNFMGNQWAGWALPEVLLEQPDEGPTVVSRARGTVMIGARPWLTNYNVPILSTDVSAARRIEQIVSARGGGLQEVQTLGQIGATPWVNNYDVSIFSTNIAAVRRIAKRVSGRGGGFPSVQALALVHSEDVIEVACNLLDPSRVGGDMVQLEVERLAEEEGMAAGKGYYTDLSEEKIIERYLKLDFHEEQKH